MATQPHIPVELQEDLEQGRCLLFVGDGLATNSTKNSLVAPLVDACAGHCKFCQSARKCMRPEDCIHPFEVAAQLYEHRFGRHDLISFVKDRLATHPPPTALYRAVAKLPARVMVTTALDDGLEGALREAGRRVLSVVRDTDIPFDDPHRVQVIRLNGTISQPDTLVLTEKDAADLFSHMSPVTRTLLQAHLATKTLIFVGYQLNDPYLRLLYTQATGSIDRMRRAAYALQAQADSVEAARWAEQITFIAGDVLSLLRLLARPGRQLARDLEVIPLPTEPYKFLDYYTRSDAGIFFGRELETDLISSLILAHRLTVVYGRSGTGKTSLLLAGVSPALEREGYHLVYARMLGDPASETKAALRECPASQLSEVDRSRPLAEVWTDIERNGCKAVLVMDQFEEFFIRQGKDTWRAFAAELANSLVALPQARIVLSLRDDYLAALDELSIAFPGDILAHRFRVENLTRDKALAAILGPAKAFGLPVEDALRDHLVADLEDQGLEPTSLQIVLYMLYRDAIQEGLWSEEARLGVGLTLFRYRTLGETREILERYLDDVLGGLDNTRQIHARAILKSMVTAEQTKAAVSSKEISRSALVEGLGIPEGELAYVLSYLRDRRVVRMLAEEEHYELAHEVLVAKVWTWLSEEELRLLDVRDMLRREVSTYRKFGQVLSLERLEIVNAVQDRLVPSVDELELLFRSALSAGVEVEYWAERARQAELPVDAIQVRRARILEFLQERYGLPDLESLCFDLGIDYDELAGGTKSERIRSLLGILERKAMLTRLLQALRETRPGPFDESGLNRPGEVPPAELNATSEARAQRASLLANLRDLLAERFSLEDIQILCFDLVVEFEDLPGNTKVLKAQSLLVYMEQAGRLDELLRAIDHERPRAIASAGLGTLDDVLAQLAARRTAPANAASAGSTSTQNSAFDEPSTTLESKLRALLRRSWGLDDLRILCFDLGIDPDELRGETRSAKADALVTELSGLERLGDLVDAMRRANPDAVGKAGLGVSDSGNPTAGATIGEE